MPVVRENNFIVLVNMLLSCLDSPVAFHMVRIHYSINFNLTLYQNQPLYYFVLSIHQIILFRQGRFSGWERVKQAVQYNKSGLRGIFITED